VRFRENFPPPATLQCGDVGAAGGPRLCAEFESAN
jgi:hypothetical protein